MAVVVPMTSRPSHQYNAGTEHVGFSPTRQILLAPSAKQAPWGVRRVAWKMGCILLRTSRVRRTFLYMDDRVFGESHEGWAAS